MTTSIPHHAYGGTRALSRRTRFTPLLPGVTFLQADSSTGTVIPTFQLAIAENDRSASAREVRNHAQGTVDFYNDTGEKMFETIHSNLQRFQEVVEPNVDEADRLFARNLRRETYRTIIKSQEAVRELAQAHRERLSREVLRGLEDKLKRYGMTLNHCQVSMSK